MKKDQKKSKMNELICKDITQRPLTFDKIIIYILFTIIFTSVLFQGLMFEAGYLKFIIIASFTGMLFFAGSFVYKVDLCWHNYSFLLCGGFSIAFGLSLINAAYTRSAIMGLSKYLCLMMVVFLISNISVRISMRFQFIIGFFVTGMGIACLGLDAIWGGKLVNIINSLLAGDQTNRGQDFLFDMILEDRLASVFQYPNTTGAFLLVAWLIGIGLWLETKKKYFNIFIGAGSVLISSALFLTLSRGTYLITVILILLCIMLLPSEDRSLYILALLSTGIVAVVLSIVFWPESNAREIGLLGWIISIVVSLFTSIMITFFKRKLLFNPDSNKNKETLSKEKSRSKKLILYVVTSLSILLLAITAIFFFWTDPIEIVEERPIAVVRRFNIKEPGNYQLKIVFNEKINADVDDLSISISTQNQKEMVMNRYTELVSSSLTTMKQQKDAEYYIPFTIPDNKSIEQTMTIAGKIFSGNKKITSMSIIDYNTGRTVHDLRLNRKFLSETVSQRIEYLFAAKSAYDRFSFYFDGLKIIKDYPLTGAGAGGWEYLYNEYQGHKYVSRDIHSFGFQLVIEVGIFGLILLIVLWLSLINKMFDLWCHPNLQQLLLWIGAVGLLAHSMIDFDFAFYSIQLLFWIFMVLLDFPKIRFLNIFAREKEKNETTQFKKNDHIITQRNWLSYFALFSIVIASLLWPLRLNIAADHAAKYTIAASKRQAIEAEQHIRKSIKYDPFNAEYKVSLAKLLVLRNNVNQKDYDEGNELVAEAKNQAKNNYVVLQKISDYYQKSGQWESAYEVENRITTIRPLTSLAWQNKGTMIQNAINWYTNQENNTENYVEQEIKWINRGLAIPEEMRMASAGKLQDVTPTNELQVLLDNWNIQIENLE